MGISGGGGKWRIAMGMSGGRGSRGCGPGK